MLETSRDILNLSISVCVAVLTFFLCWGIFYVVMMLKKMHQTVNLFSEFIASLKVKLDRLESLIATIEEKVKHSASYLPLLMQGIADLMGFIKRKREEKTDKKKIKK